MAVKNYSGERYTGLAADTKPTNVANGAMFVEIDTGLIFSYNGGWQECGYLRVSAKATQADAETGTENTRYMTALRVKQAIDEFAGASGENNTASNVGTGSGVFKDKVGADLRFKSLTGGARLSIDETNPDELQFEFDMADILLGANNLSDLTNAATARINLGLGSAATQNTGTAAGNVPILDGSGKLNESVIPSLAISEIHVVADDTARDALTVQTGDVAIVDSSAEAGDEPATYIYDGTVWQKMKSPTDAVNSVFGRTGVVTAQANDYTWAQIDKTVSSIADITTRSHTDLQDIGTNTHAQIDTHIADAGKHREINDAGTGVTDLWSADKINTEVQNAAGSPGGANRQVQFNNAGEFAGDAGLEWDNTNKRLETTGGILIEEGGTPPVTVEHDQGFMSVSTETVGADTIVTHFLETGNGKVIVAEYTYTI